MTKEGAQILALKDKEQADLLPATVSYLTFLGVDIDGGHLIAGLPLSGTRLTEDLLARAVGRLGFVVKWESARDLRCIDLPCCVELKKGEFVVLVEATEDGFRATDHSVRGGLRDIAFNWVEEGFSGRLFRLLPSVQLIQRRHSIDTEKGHWFWGRIFEKKSRVLDVVLASLVANVLAVVVSLFAMQVYDRVIPGKSEATLWVLVVGVAIAISFEATLKIARARLIDQTGKEADLKIAQNLFERLVGMRLGTQPAPPGALVHMVREFGAVREFFTAASVGVVADIPFVLLFLMLIYGIAGPITWIIVFGALLTIIPSLLLQGAMSRLSKEAMGGMSSASRVLTEAAYGLETVKVSLAEARFQKIWEEIVNLNAVKTTEQRRLSAFLTFWAGAVQQCTYVAAVVGGVYLVFSGEFTTGSIIAVSILSTRTLSPITQMSGVLSRWQNMKVSLEGLESIMSAQQDRDLERTYLRRPRLTGKIEFKNVTFSHRNSQVDSFKTGKFSIPAGSKLAILGENGSGKSTFLRLAAGLILPTVGEVEIDGLDIRQIDPTDLRRNIAYLPQELHLFRGTLRDNLEAGGIVFEDERLYQALSFGGLAEFVRHHPKGLDLDIADGGSGLSTGQKQSLGLARLFLQDPSIVLLDEPTAALDQQLENAVVERLGDWLGNRTCIVATHRISILSKMERVAVMKKGQFLLEGGRDAVLKQISSRTELR